MDHQPDKRWASLRASNDDREQTVSTLRQHHAVGRLTIEELTERMDRALGARTLGDLDLLSNDLPLLPPPLLSHPAEVARRRYHQHLLGYIWTNAVLVLVWALSCAAVGRLLFFWPAWTLLGWGTVLGAHAVRAFRPQKDDPGGGRRLASVDLGNGHRSAGIDQLHALVDFDHSRQ